MSQPSIVVLTGAGVSAESGIKTFRDANGLWENHSIEEVASIDGFLVNPRVVHRFYNQRRRQLFHDGIEPNLAHLALARLEKEWSGDFLLVTQNVDNLHDRAGSRKLLHMHGELGKVRCQASEKVFEWKEDLSVETICIDCGRTGCLRPHIVWFGEMPFHMEEIYEALRACDIFIAIGTSGNVYPAAGFVQEVAPQCRTIEMNADRTMVSSFFDERIIGPAGVEVPKLVEELLKL